MKSYRIPVVLMLVALQSWLSALRAEESSQKISKSPTTQPAKTKPQDLTVAILDFAADDPGAPKLGSQIGEVLTAMLSGEPGFTLVDRSTLARTLQEHELNLSGVVETQKAIEIGKIVGARILVAGKAFPLGKQLFITAKLIGTETSLVEGILIKGSNTSDVDELIVRLAEKVGARLREAGPMLVADKDAAKDPLPALRKQLGEIKLPKIAVIVTEEHIAQRVERPVVDPAVETEIKLLLRECGFEIMDVKENELADWARFMSEKNVNAWPRGLQGVDMVITGEAFSEFAARIGNLVSCSARAEVNLISRQSGKIVFADRRTCRAVDLSENIAGKKALQKTGRGIGIRILTHFAKTTKPQETQSAK